GTVFPDPGSGVFHRQAIVSETMTKTLWPGESAIGKRLRLQDGHTPADVWYTVVGVVGGVEMPANLGSPPSRMQLYLPMELGAAPYFNVILRSPLAPEVL